MRECGVEDFTICSGTGFRIKCIPVASENTSALVKHDIFVSARIFSEYNRGFLLPTHMVLIVARQVSAAEEKLRQVEKTAVRQQWLHPKHCNLMVLPLINTSQDTFRHQVVSFSMNNELGCVLALEYFTVK